VTCCSRRIFLTRTLRAAAGLGCLAVLPAAGCGRADERAPQPLRVPLADLPADGRLRRELGGVPVEIVRRGDTVTARSLLCTHQGCEVAWRADENAYVCPCHDGRFDAAGRPTYGPPRLPLREMTVMVSEGEVVVTD
jgi:Rieske Fe-S protein